MFTNISSNRIAGQSEFSNLLLEGTSEPIKGYINWLITDGYLILGVQNQKGYNDIFYYKVAEDNSVTLDYSPIAEGAPDGKAALVQLIDALTN